MCSDAAIGPGAKIGAAEAQQPTECDTIFGVEVQLEEGKALLRCDAIEGAFLVIGFAGNAALDERVMDGIADRAALRQYQDVLWSPIMILNLVLYEIANSESFLLQRAELENLNIPAPGSRDADVSDPPACAPPIPSCRSGPTAPDFICTCSAIHSESR